SALAVSAAASGVTLFVVVLVLFFGRLRAALESGGRLHAVRLFLLAPTFVPSRAARISGGIRVVVDALSSGARLASFLARLFRILERECLLCWRLGLGRCGLVVGRRVLAGLGCWLACLLLVQAAPGLVGQRVSLEHAKRGQIDRFQRAALAALLDGHLPQLDDDLQRAGVEAVELRLLVLVAQR